MGFAIRVPILNSWNQKHNITTKTTNPPASPERLAMAGRGTQRMKFEELLNKVLLELRVLRGIYYRL